MKIKKTLFALSLLCGTAFSQMAPDAPYWTTSRKLNTVGVTAFHVADAAQTCWHESHNDDGKFHEVGMGSPKSCVGVSAYLIGVGPVLQYASYRMTRRFPESRLMYMVDRALPHIEMAISFNAIRCTNFGTCHAGGF